MILLLFGKDRVRNEMKKLLTVKSNVDLILGVEPEEVKREGHRNGDGKKKHPQDGQPHQQCVMGDLGFSPTSRNRAVFSPEKISRFAERVSRVIACHMYLPLKGRSNALLRGSYQTE